MEVEESNSTMRTIRRMARDELAVMEQNTRLVMFRQHQLFHEAVQNHQRRARDAVDQAALVPSTRCEAALSLQSGSTQASKGMRREFSDQPGPSSEAINSVRVVVHVRVRVRTPSLLLSLPSSPLPSPSPHPLLTLHPPPLSLPAPLTLPPPPPPPPFFPLSRPLAMFFGFVWRTWTDCFDWVFGFL